MRLATLRIWLYTFPGGAPMIRLHIASLASLILENDPMMCTFWSAITIRVRVPFSMAYLVLPS